MLVKMVNEYASIFFTTILDTTLCVPHWFGFVVLFDGNVSQSESGNILAGEKGRREVYPTFWRLKLV